jgi:hypothetical protein
MPFRQDLSELIRSSVPDPLPSMRSVDELLHAWAKQEAIMTWHASEELKSDHDFEEVMGGMDAVLQFVYSSRTELHVTHMGPKQAANLCAKVNILLGDKARICVAYPWSFECRKDFVSEKENFSRSIRGAARCVGF